MGKHNRNASKAFTAAVDRREALIKNLKECTSSGELDSILKKYESQKNKQLYAIPKGLAATNSTKIETLNEEIRLLILAEKQKFNPKVEELKPSDTQELEQYAAAHQNNGETQELDSENTLKPTASKSTTAPISEFIIASRKKAIAFVTEQLEVINEIRKAFATETSEEYLQAANAAQQIHQKIEDLSDKYINDGDLDSYKKECAEALKEDDKDVQKLNEPRGMKLKTLFGNIGLFILGLGFISAAICAYRGKFFDFKTNSAIEVDKLAEKVSSVAPSA